MTVAVAVGAVVGGFALGVLDFVWIRFVPFPFGALGNSSAVWAVAAFAFGYLVRHGLWRAGLGAAVLLVVAVPGYYVAAVWIQHDDWASIWAPSSFLWMCFGVLAGVVFGGAGVWAGTGGWRRTVGVALPAAVLFAEALRWIRHGGPAVLDALLGVVVVALLTRRLRPLLAGLGLALLLALPGWAGFALARFG